MNDIKKLNDEMDNYLKRIKWVFAIPIGIEIAGSILFGRVEFIGAVGILLIVVVNYIFGYRLKKLLRQYIESVHQEDFRLFQKNSMWGIAHQKYYRFFKSKEYQAIDDEKYFTNQLNKSFLPGVLGFVVWGIVTLFLF